LRSLIDLPTTVEFQTGLLIGLAGLAVTSLFRRRHLDWALVWALCALVALVRIGTFAERRPVRSLDPQLWVLLAGLVVCAVAAAGLVGGRAHPHVAAGFAATMLGVWATVPDTEAASALAGVTAAMIWSWWPLRFAFPRTAGAGAAAAIAALSTIIGAGRRDVAVVGGFGILAALGSFALLKGWPGRAPAPLIGVHLALVGVWFSAARIWSEPVGVFVGGVVASSLVVGAAWLLARRTGLSIDQVENPGNDPVPPSLIK
jgi:hypothetical protein